MDMRRMVNCTPSESLQEDLTQSIDSGIQKEIAQVQLEAFHKINLAMESVPKAENVIREQNPMWTEPMIKDEADILLNNHCDKITGDAKQAIMALFALRAYRVEGLTEYLETVN